MFATTGKQIQSGKILIKNVFDKDMWYRVPEYQRPYVWGDDQINALLDDIAYAAVNSQDSEYFLGSIVLHFKAISDEIAFTDNDLLDGQQRLTTLYLIHAVIRDLTDNHTLKQSCKVTIFTEADPFNGIPERMRIIFDIREEVQIFVDKYIKPDGGTLLKEELQNEATKSEDNSVRNMAKAILRIQEWFSNGENIGIDAFYRFLRNQVLLVYVASQNLDDAFRLFTVLNDRGIKLRNSDILKAENLKHIPQKEERKKYAKQWEEIEGELGEEFDQFLSYVRTILVKEKARLNLLKEFEDNIYYPKSFNQETKKYENKTPLLYKGKDTFDLIKKYKDHYDTIFSGHNYDQTKNWAFDNLLSILNTTALSDIWVPPLLAYREAFGDFRILDFLIKLDNKFSGDWIAGESPTFRIEAMNDILKHIGDVSSQPGNKEEKVAKLMSSVCFHFDKGEFYRQLGEGTIYNRRFARYILCKLDYLYGSNAEKRSFQHDITVEHILPQNPDIESQWVKDFSEEDRQTWTHRLGNLVLISRRKNTSQGRLDYSLKKVKYFEKSIETFPNSLRVLNNNHAWKLDNLQGNHSKVLEDLDKHYN